MLEFNIKKISIFGICKFLIICFVCPKKTYIYILIFVIHYHNKFNFYFSYTEGYDRPDAYGPPRGGGR